MTPTRPEDRSQVDVRPATAAPAPVSPGPVAHEVTVTDGRFTRASCTCGWVGTARRHRSTARAEARDHALLYADGGSVVDLRDEPRRT